MKTQSSKCLRLLICLIVCHGLVGCRNEPVPAGSDSTNSLESGDTSSSTNPVGSQSSQDADQPEKKWSADKETENQSLVTNEKTVRFATFNVALNRKQPGQLAAELESGTSRQAAQIAEVIQRVRPQVILLNEVDYDEAGKSISALQKQYLSNPQNGHASIEYPHVYFQPVNTGVLSPLDMNQDGKVELPNDGYGFGAFPGQYGMVVLSQFPVRKDSVRTFQKFLWKDMPKAMKPISPDDKKPYYPSDVFAKIRLSSKSHWDVPLNVHGKTIHLICSHPTPPVFDGPEDRNGCRNHDEIRMVVDYVSGKGDYLYDDAGRTGGLPEGEFFVIAGDLNADPFDGASTKQAARQLTENPYINNSVIPSSKGAKTAASISKQKNDEHKGNPANDTGDFNDKSVGNMRIDYCLPSANLKILDCGVFWPAPDTPGFELNKASDHHLVWVDIALD